jgi:hypothetical protein
VHLELARFNGYPQQAHSTRTDLNKCELATHAMCRNAVAASHISGAWPVATMPDLEWRALNQLHLPPQALPSSS